MAEAAVLIGIDLGTTSVKGVMCDVSGAVLDRWAGRHAMARPVAGAAEQAPADWLAAVEAALARFAAHPRAGEVAAIGVTGQVNTHVFCDAALTPLRPAITWQDGRAAAQGARLDAAIGAAAKAAALGAPIPIDASHALSRLAWVERHEPGVRAAVRHLLLPKDWMIARLTGEVGADPISAVGLVGADHVYATPVLALVEGAAELLPPLSDPLALAGRVLRGPFAGVPVVRGTMDAWASLFGLGLGSEGDGMYLSGTSEVLALIASGGPGAPGVVTFPPWRGIALHAGPTQAGGASLEWAARLLGQSVTGLSDLVAEVRIGRDAPLFLPHLEGERAPLWDVASRGGFAGLASAHGPADIAAAVMEGVAFSARLALEAVERSGGRRAARLRLGGGGATSPVWARIRASALGRAVEPVLTGEPGALGALVMAGAGTGLLDGLGTAVALVRTGPTVEPDAAAAALAEHRFAAWAQLHSALRPVTDRLRL